MLTGDATLTREQCIFINVVVPLSYIMNLSVIIPAHGKEDLLIRCLKSLDKDTQGDSEYEVFVVDDGSGLDEYAVRTQTKAQYPITWHAFEMTRGRSAARNTGIRATTGEIIVFLDSDMEAREGFIRAHLKHHLEHRHTAVIGNIIWPKGGSFLKYIGSRGVAKLNTGDDVPPWYFVTGNASLERADLPEGSTFDETLPGWGGEDLDLGLKLHSAGVKFLFAPEAVSYHNFKGDLPGHINRTEFYGKTVLPILVKRHPELKKILRLDLMDSLFWRMAVNNIFYLPLKYTVRILDAIPLPARFFDYLTFASYARGWLKVRQS